MARIRSIKPQFFRDEDLQDLEIMHPGQYIMLVFAGLWTLCDNQGVFQFKPRLIKLDILPFIDFDMNKTLQILSETGHIFIFEVNGEKYGHVVSFLNHQIMNTKEAKEGKRFPSVKDADIQTDISKGHDRDISGTVPIMSQNSTGTCEGLQEKEKEKEREEGESVAHTREEDLTHSDFSIEEKIEENPDPTDLEIKNPPPSCAPPPLSDAKALPDEEIIEILLQDQVYCELCIKGTNVQDMTHLRECAEKFILYERKKRGAMQLLMTRPEAYNGLRMWARNERPRIRSEDKNLSHDDRQARKQAEIKKKKQMEFGY